MESTNRPDWTIAEIAEHHKLSRQTVTKIFAKEKGIVEIPGGGKLRRHRTIRVPHTVYLRVFGSSGRLVKAMRRARKPVLICATDVKKRD